MIRFPDSISANGDLCHHMNPDMYRSEEICRMLLVAGGRDDTRSGLDNFYGLDFFYRMSEISDNVSWRDVL